MTPKIDLFPDSFDLSAPLLPMSIDELPRDPAAVVRRSPLIARCCACISEAAAAITDGALREQCVSLLKEPALKCLDRWRDPAKARRLYEALADCGLLDRSGVSATDFLPPPAPEARFEAAPGSGWDSHHSYPGGLAVHVATNLRTSLDHVRLYEGFYGTSLDRDTVIAAQLAHDASKTVCHQWLPGGGYRFDWPIAGKTGHLVIALAESIERGLPAHVLLAQACAHTSPFRPEGEAEVAGWLKAACLIASRDPVELGLLAPGEQELPRPHRHEWLAVHFGDGDYPLAIPAARSAVALLRRLAAERYGLSKSDLDGERFAAFRNYVGAHLSFMWIDHTDATQGCEAVSAAVAKLVRP